MSDGRPTWGMSTVATDVDRRQIFDLAEALAVTN